MGSSLIYIHSHSEQLNAQKEYDDIVINLQKLGLSTQSLKEGAQKGRLELSKFSFYQNFETKSWAKWRKLEENESRIRGSKSRFKSQVNFAT